MNNLLLMILMFATFAIISGIITAEQRKKGSLPASLYIGVAIAFIAVVLLLAGVFN